MLKTSIGGKMIPFQITFLDLPESDFVWVAVQKRIEKLEKHFDRIIRCEVVISCPHRHRHADRLYHVQVHIHLPGEDVIVSRNSPENEAHRDIYVAIRDSFNATDRILQDRINILRHNSKPHEQNF
jgi:ribosomal subunit interface protein